MNITTIEGDLLDQDVDAIVNAWNRNVIPLIGAGTGGGRAEAVHSWMTDELAKVPYEGDVRIVRFSKS